MTVNPGRDKIWLATIHRRELRAMRQAFHSEAQARAWIEQQRQLSTTFVGYACEAIWMSAD